MKLVRLTDGKGNVVHINPEYVVFISPASAGGVPSVGEAAVVLNNGVTLVAKGTPEEIAISLTHPTGFVV
jgi:hypothetical protein